MKRARVMDLTWLAACAFQMGLLSGCGSAVNSLGSPLASAQADEAAPVAVPVRISRAALEKPLSSLIQIRVNGGALSQWNSDAKWVEEETRLPAPDPTQGVVLADFRDRQGCVLTPQGAGLCFRVQPDVDSVAAKAEDMSLRGIEELVPASCRAAASHLALRRAEHSGSGLAVRYSGSQDGCELNLDWTIT